MRYRLFALGLSVLLGLCLIGAVAWIAPVRANAPFTVDSTVDEIDAAPGDGNCVSTPSGQCTLRAAIMEANALVGDDTITVPAGIYTLTLTGANEDAGLTGDLDITSTVTIEGAGAKGTVVDANALDRVLDILTATVHISGTTLQNGYADTGGGLRNLSGSVTITLSIITNNIGTSGAAGLHSFHGYLTLLGTSIQNNSTPNFGGGMLLDSTTVLFSDSRLVMNTAGGGGGVYAFSSVMTITNSFILSNTAIGGGGGFHNDYGMKLVLIDSVVRANVAKAGGGLTNLSELTIMSSTVSDNTAYETSSSYGGGGIINFGNLTLTTSSILSNSTGYFGGGIYGGPINMTNTLVSGNFALVDGGGIAGSGVFVNSTISQNQAAGSGGGMRICGTINNLTITDNIADSDNNGSGDGGGLKIYPFGGCTVTTTNTLISANVDQSGTAPDCSGILTSLGYNLIQNTTNCTISGTLTGVITSTDPLLGPLQDNGGPTFTHALLSGSPAIDAGNPSGCTDWLGMLLTTDQRGFLRPVDGGSGIARCDIGAYEYAPSAVPLWLYLPILRR